ncbi:MAG TPA: cytochrome c3 family protein [Polyangia bacterium]|jgi:predicted CXXCH cytochrome family protein
MRRILQVAVVAATLIGAAAYAGIAGSKHDLSLNFAGFNPAGSAPTNEICRPCHTPHNANGNLVPLWNHTTTTQTFIPYTSTTMTGGTAGVPTGGSLACMSCHDGITAVDAFGGSTTGGHAMAGASTANLGLDLSNDHPIGFSYQASVAADPGIIAPATPGVCVTLAGTTCETPLYGATGNMECATCHAVHGSGVIPKFLRVNNAGSALCLKCHNK